MSFSSKEVVASAVVVVVGSVAFGAWYSARRSVCGSTEAAVTLQALRGAEESHRAETGHYLGCAADGPHDDGRALGPADLAPRALEALSREKVPLDARTPVGACLVGTLAFRPAGPVRGTYGATAGEPPRQPQPVLAGTRGALDRAPPIGTGEPWYELVALTQDGDGRLVRHFTHSGDARVFVEEDGADRR